MKIFPLILLLSFAACAPGSPLDLKKEDASPLSRIFFGSCNKHHLPQPVWAGVLQGKPDIWIWTGDIIYGDTMDMAVLAQKYQAQKNRPDYQKLLSLKIPILGTWDDHDYGINDGGIGYPRKMESQQILLDFLDEPPESPRRRQEGIYQSYLYGPPGKQVKILLLDVRYFREENGPDKDILGEAQWKFLERELTGSSAQIHLIISGTQIIPNDHRFEKWANFPRARKRFFKTIKEARASGVILISGDRHFAEISRLEPEEEGVPYPIYEVTSSGLTHTFTPLNYEHNSHRVGKIFKDLHFGAIVVDWEKAPVTVRLEVRGKENVPAIQREVELREISW